MQSVFRVQNQEETRGICQVAQETTLGCIWSLETRGSSCASWTVWASLQKEGSLRSLVDAFYRHRGSCQNAGTYMSRWYWYLASLVSPHSPGPVADSQRIRTLPKVATKWRRLESEGLQMAGIASGPDSYDDYNKCEHNL